GFGDGVGGGPSGALCAAIRLYAATASGTPWPRSIFSEPSSINRFAPSCNRAVVTIALRIWCAVALGNACRRTAAMPATIGALNDVPLAMLIVLEQASWDWFGQYPCPILPNALTMTCGSMRPSAVGPRELNTQVCVPEEGRYFRPAPGPTMRSRRIR